MATNYFTPANFTMTSMSNGDEIYAIDGPCNRTWLSTLPDLTFSLESEHLNTYNLSIPADVYMMEPASG